MKVIPFQIPKVEEESFRFQEDLQPVFYDKLHQHKEIQLTRIVNGKGTFIAGSTIIPFTAGDIFLIASQVPHVFRSDSETETTQSHSVSLYFDGNSRLFQSIPEMKAIRDYFNRQGYVYKINHATQTGQTIENQLNVIKNETSSHRLIPFIYVMDKIVKSPEDVTEISSSVDIRNFTDKEGHRMNDIIQHTFNHCHRDISISEIAEIAHLTPEAFCRYFKLRTRKTYITFLNEIRISHACKLLDQTDLTITEVCFKTGFNNVSNFNRMFKRMTGITPREYNKR